MFDAVLRPLINRPLDALGRRLGRAGVEADAITVAGAAVGLVAALMVASGVPAQWALVPLALNRLCDGLDGAVARHSVSGPTDRGGFLDIALDFVFYGAMPLAFAVADPASNALPACVLLFSFLANGTSFLAFATLAAKRGLETAAQGRKSIFYLSGIAEGTETVVFFFAFCAFPQFFPWLAGVFAAMCIVSAGARIWGGARLLG